MYYNVETIWNVYFPLWIKGTSALTSGFAQVHWSLVLMDIRMIIHENLCITFRTFSYVGESSLTGNHCKSMCVCVCFQPYLRIQHAVLTIQLSSRYFYFYLFYCLQLDLVLYVTVQFIINHFVCCFATFLRSIV